MEKRSEDSARSDTAAGMSETMRWRLPEIRSSLAASVLQEEGLVLGSVGVKTFSQDSIKPRRSAIMIKIQRNKEQN